MKGGIPTIEELRKLEWKVRVIPFRNLNQRAKYRSQLSLVPEYHARFISNIGHLTNGGKIVIEISPPKSNTVFKGDAVAHPFLNFNKKRLRLEALKKALSKAGIK